MLRCGVWGVAIAIVLAPSGAVTSRGVERTAPEVASIGSTYKISPACAKSIDRGTKWLISAMRMDGSLGADVGRPPDLACTSIFGLVLLSQGNTLSAGPYRKELSQVLDAVLNMVERLPPDYTATKINTLVQRKIGANADLFVSAMFLSQLLGEAAEAESDVRAALEKLVAIVCRAQGQDGTWGNESWAPVLGTVLGWECLRASSSAGLRVDASARLAGEALLKNLQNNKADRHSWMHDFYKNASGVRVLYSLNYRHERAFQDCVARILRIAKEDDRPFVEAGGEEYLAFFLVTECLLQEPDESWSAWYPTVRDKIMRVQNADGSWSGHHCITARTFCTAAAMLTLQAANQYMPLSNL
jgi:hypothetical protein